MQRSVPAATAVAVGLLLCVGGLTRLSPDGARAYALPPASPLPALTAAVSLGTGGDDLLALVITDEGSAQAGLLRPEGLELLSDCRELMLASPFLERVQSVTHAPILSDSEGSITAVTPLEPAPDSASGWEEARARVLGDDFVRGLLISEDAHTAAVVGWIWRGSTEQAISRLVEQALRDPSFRESETGRAVRGAIDGARLAILLGEAEGSPEGETLRRLEEIAREDAALAEQLADWVETAEADRAIEVHRSLQEGLEGLRAGAGMRVGIAGPSVVQEALERAVPSGVRAGLLGLLLVVGLGVALRSRSVSAAGVSVLATGLSFAASLGIMGLLGLPLHGLTAGAALLGAAWTAGLCAALAGGKSRPILEVAALAVASLLPWLALGDSGALLAGAVAWAAASLSVLAASTFLPRHKGPSGMLRVRRGPGLAALGSCLLAALALQGSPLGVDPAGMLSASEPAGAATRALASGLGTAPAGHLVASGQEGQRALASPEALRALREAQDIAEALPGVRGTRSWADFVSALHAQVSGEASGSLPGSVALVDQYLLAFGRPEDTRMLVAPSLDLGVALVRMEAGQGARLAELADRFPGDGDGVVLAGSAVELALATRNGARGMLPWLALSLIWCTVLSGVLLRRRGEPAGALFAGLALPPAAASCSLVAGSCVLGSLSPLLLASACGVLILSSTALLLERSAAIGLLVTAGVGLAPMLLSSATELQAVAVAQGAGCLLAVLLCLPRRVAR